MSGTLLYTPHFCLGHVNYDPNKIKAELAELDKETWSGYNNDVLKVRNAGTSMYWTAKFLRNFSPDPDFGFGETIDYLKMINKEGFLKNGRCQPEHLVKTRLWDRMPETCQIVSQLATIELCDRILVSKVKAGERVNWHSHCQYEKKYTHAYVHVPLVTNSQCEMLVYMDGKIHAKKYEAGSAWIINTQHNHAVNNLEGEERIHLLILASFEDPKFLAKLANAQPGTA